MLFSSLIHSHGLGDLSLLGPVKECSVLSRKNEFCSKPSTGFSPTFLHAYLVTEPWSVLLCL